MPLIVLKYDKYDKWWVQSEWLLKLFHFMRSLKELFSVTVTLKGTVFSHDIEMELEWYDIELSVKQESYHWQAH